MTPMQCFAAKMKAGVVSAKAGEALAERVDAFEKEWIKRGEKADNAARRAARDAAGDAETIAAREAELALAGIKAQLDVVTAHQVYDETLGALRTEGRAPLWLRDWRKSPAFSAFRSLMTRDPNEIGGWANVHYQARNIRAQAHGMFIEGIRDLAPKRFGLKQEKALELEVLQAIKNKGAQVSDGARAIADAWHRTAEFLRQTFVAAHGALPFREGWGLPNPVHDTLKIRSIRKEDWIDDIWDRLDRKAMVNFETGRRLNNTDLRRMLSEMYDTVAAGGAEGLPTSAQRGSGALASRRADSRFIVFKSAEDWIDYDAKFGSGGGVYHTMMQHIENMSDDVAMLQVLGPNPEATIRFMHGVLDREGARLAQTARLSDGKDAQLAAFRDNVKIASYVGAQHKGLDRLWAEISGANKVPVHLEAAHAASEVRAGLTGSKMGSAIISSFADVALASMTARFNGLPAGALLKRVVAGMKDMQFELDAAQLGVVADSIAYTMQHNDRFMGETIRTGRLAQLGTAVIGASGLRRWSGVMRAGFAMEFMAQGANHMTKAWEALPVQFCAAMERRGLGADDWEVIRTAEATDMRGGRFLTANDIRQLDGGKGRVADSWQRMIDTEMDYAVIEGDPLTRAFILGESRPGTADGELRRFMGQFKAFPITFINLHFARTFARGFDMDRLGHAALTFMAMTAMGMVSMQSKEMLKGRDPISMDPSSRIGLRAWGAAMLQSGGLGIFGDLLFQDQTRQGASFAAALAGPAFGEVERIAGDWIIGNIQKAAKGQPTHFTGDALYALGGLVPGQSLWYARLAFQRAVLDRLALMADDRAPERFRRIEKEAEKSWGQRFWWEPGVSTPRRAPDPAAALEKPH